MRKSVIRYIIAVNDWADAVVKPISDWDSFNEITKSVDKFEKDIFKSLGIPEDITIDELREEFCDQD